MYHVFYTFLSLPEFQYFHLLSPDIQLIRHVICYKPIYSNCYPNLGSYSHILTLMPYSFLQVPVMFSNIFRISNQTLYPINRDRLFLFHCQCQRILEKLILLLFTLSKFLVDETGIYHNDLCQELPLPEHHWLPQVEV